MQGWRCNYLGLRPRVEGLGFERFEGKLRTRKHYLDDLLI